MAPASSRRRRRSNSDDNDNDNGDSARYSDPSQSINSPKRQRLAQIVSRDETLGQDSNQPARTSLANDNDQSGFQPGAIVRVKVHNFVTYEEAEFFPGPHLNMVIGPNGTGKSSLVCAICLGLGYSPKHLGRAGSVKEFVKHGKDVATIEIEIYKRPTDDQNFIIKVQIRREQNSQRWWMNGKETNHKTIQSLMPKFKIQVDNLCQFLPQDRVVEFAACTPVDLLHETLRAAAPEEMLMWKNQLRRLYKEKKEATDTVQTANETLRNLEGRQQGLQAEVERLREREEILEQAKNLKSALNFAIYDEAQSAFNSAKERRRRAEKSLRHLEKKSGPSLAAVNKKQDYVYQITNAVAAKNKELRAAEDVARRLAREVTTASDDVKEFDAKFEARVKNAEAKKRDFAQSRSKITALQGDLKNKPDEFDPAEFNRSIRGEEHKLRELEAEQREKNNQLEAVKGKGREVTATVKRIEDDIAGFNTQQGQQLNFMKKQFPEVARAWDWISEHQDKFEKEVFGPPLVCCSVKDEKYSDQVQSFLQTDDFTCFTAQTKTDYKTLADQLYGEMSLSVVIRTCAHPLESFQRPVNEAEAKELGLDGFAIDFLEGPAPVLAMMCAEKRLHQSGVSLGNHNDAQYERLIQGGKVNQWAAGEQSFTVRRRREYGPQAMTAITKNIRSSRFWTSQPIDYQEREEISRKLNEARVQRDGLKEEFRSTQARLTIIQDRKEEIQVTIDRLKQEKSALQKEYQRWQSLPDKIESEERANAVYEQAMHDSRKQILELLYAWDEAVVRRVEIILQYKEAINQIREAHHALLEAEIRSIEAESDVRGLKDRNADIMEHLKTERESLNQAVEEVASFRETGREALRIVKDLLDKEPDKRELFSRLAMGKTSAEIQMEIDAELAKLELIHATNPNVIREFERRAQEITRLQRQMQGSREKVEELSREIDGLMSRWEPELDSLVSKINDAFAYNFEQISCAGEIRIHKPEDFEEWALDIMVRFRENETLQRLTAHRQSGGERAVSTIFYLMALQSMAQSPFRVVDEINQGMDPRNERMVHERMVEIACREHTSQYFLITPKLLTGLRYDPKMRILCIASGEHIPREGQKLDFRRCLETQKRLMAAM